MNNNAANDARKKAVTKWTKNSHFVTTPLFTSSIRFLERRS